MNLRHAPGLSAISDRYGAFLVDQYGVLHDGERLYPDAADAIAKLAAKKSRGQRPIFSERSMTRDNPK